MEDRKKLTVRHLRELARKHVMPDSSKPWKDGLLAALKRRVPDFVKEAVARVEGAVARAEARVEGAIARVEGAVKRRVESQARAKAKSKAKVKRPEAKAPLLKSREVKGGQGRRASSKAAPPEPTPERATSKPERPAMPVPVSGRSPPSVAAEPASASSEHAELPPAAQPPASPPPPEAPSSREPFSEGPRPRRYGRHPRQPEPRPITEGFFVARPAEAEAGRAPPVVARPPAPPDAEGLGALPPSYDRDSTVAMARDPRTLFVFWSFGQRTLVEAAAELDSPVSRIRVYDGETLVREEPFSLEARNSYLSGLPAGRRLRVELHLVGRDGRHRRLGPPSATVMLPSEGPAAEAQIRFMRVDPGTPLDEAEATVSEGLEPGTHFIAWERLPLPGSAEGPEWKPQARKRGRQLVPPPGAEASADRGWSPLSPSGQGLALERGWAPLTPSGKVPKRLFPRWRSWVSTPSGQGLGVKVSWSRVLPGLALPPPARGWAPPSASGQVPEVPERGWAPPSASGQGPGVSPEWSPAASGQGPGVPERGWAPGASGHGPGVGPSGVEHGGALASSGHSLGVGVIDGWMDWAPAGSGPEVGAYLWRGWAAPSSEPQAPPPADARGGPPPPLAGSEAPAPVKESPRAEPASAPSPAAAPPAPVQSEDAKAARAERDWPAAVSAEGIVTAAPPGRRRRGSSNPDKDPGSGSSR